MLKLLTGDSTMCVCAVCMQGLLGNVSHMACPDHFVLPALHDPVTDPVTACLLAAARGTFKYHRNVKLGEPFVDVWPLPRPDLPPEPTAAKQALGQTAAAAATGTDSAHWGSAAGSGGATAAAYGGTYNAYNMGTAQDTGAWAQQQQQPSLVLQAPVARAPKLSKKQLKQQQLAAKKAAAAARKSKKRRRGDDFDSEDDDTEVRPPDSTQLSTPC